MEKSFGKIEESSGIFSLLSSINMMTTSIPPKLSLIAKRHGITFHQYMVLREIYIHPDFNPSEIARKWNCSKSSISVRYTKLVTDNLVVEEIDSDDRRRKNTAVTTRGNKVYQSMTADYEQAFKPMIDQLNYENLQSFTAIITAMLNLDFKIE